MVFRGSSGWVVRILEWRGPEFLGGREGPQLYPPWCLFAPVCPVWIVGRASTVCSLRPGGRGSSQPHRAHLKPSGLRIAWGLSSGA